MAVGGHRDLMDQVYRHQRHIYDLTRKYYLLGRDPMIAGLKPPGGGTVLEIACGTGRNLIKAARLYPEARFFGLDISDAMLGTARKAVSAARLEGRVHLAQADAAAFDPAALFGIECFDRVFISYAVSMIPPWQAVVWQAAATLAPGGELHIVDFGDLAGLPSVSRALLYRWLTWFHVTPRANLFEHSGQVAHRLGMRSRQISLYNGFAWISVIENGDAVAPLVENAALAAA